MKKLSVTILGLCFALKLFGQGETTDKKFYMSVLAIPTLSWANTADAKHIANNGSKMGINLGLAGDFMITKNYAFSVELLHSFTGAKITADSIVRTNPDAVGQNIDLNYSFSAFQIPVSFKLKTNEIGYMTYWAQLGIAPSFIYKARVDYTAPSNFFATPEDAENINPNEKDNDFVGTSKNWLEEDDVAIMRIPLLIGAGTEWNLSGNTSLIGGIRYEYGLGSFMKAENTTVYRHSFGLVLGVRF